MAGKCRTCCSLRLGADGLRDKLRLMDSRSKEFLKASGLMLSPVVIFLPAFIFAKVGPCGPTTGWSLTLFVAISMYCEVRAFNIFRTGFSAKSDVLRLLRFPFGFFCIGIVFLSAFIFVFLALPALVFGDLPNLFSLLHR